VDRKDTVVVHERLYEFMYILRLLDIGADDLD